MAQSGFGAGEAGTIAVCLLASVLAGWLLYRLVETPFMRLRERWVPARAAVLPAARATFSPARGPAPR
jgi:peptidoglycan/LPS O-acetylase OafA/YrhL